MPLDEGTLLLPDEPLSLLADRKFSRLLSAACARVTAQTLEPDEPSLRVEQKGNYPGTREYLVPLAEMQKAAELTEIKGGSKNQPA